MSKYYALFFFMVLSVPLLLGLNAWQANKCGTIRNEIKSIEKSQENCVKNNKAISNDILDILAIDSLETKARDMGLRKKGPEDVMLIIVGGGERGY